MLAREPWHCTVGWRVNHPGGVVAKNAKPPVGSAALQTDAKVEDVDYANGVLGGATSAEEGEAADRAERQRGGLGSRRECEKLRIIKAGVEVCC